jgi:predicted dehydrogenase
MTTHSQGPFRIGIIGCGRIANAHVHAALATPEVKLTALVDPVQERAHALAGRFGVSVAVHSSVREAIHALDGAVIAAPNHLHAEIATECLHAGVPVLIEKPLASSVADGRRICEVAEKAGLTVAVGYVTRFTEANRLMGDLLRRDAFGRVRRFHYQFGTRGGWAPLSAYNLDVKSAGGGVLVVTGTHFLDRMLDWFGYPVHSQLRDDSRGGPEANAVATFEFDHPSGPIVGTARFSKAVALEAGIVLETDAGTVILRDRPGAPILVRTERTPHLDTALSMRRDPTASGRPGEFVQQLEDFITAIRTGRSPMVSGESGLASLRLLEQLYRDRQPIFEDWYQSLTAVEVGS